MSLPTLRHAGTAEPAVAGATSTAGPGGTTPYTPAESTRVPDGLLTPPEAADELGRIGGYRVLRSLGHGGMGLVLLAVDPALDRRVAIKVMLPDVAARSWARDRFLREARAAAAIEHPNVVPIFQVGEDRGVPFIVMPYLKGETLAGRLAREGKLPAADLVRVGREIAAGLAAAHAAGLIHRDVKPANIWLEAGTGAAKLLDFGIARPDDSGSRDGSTGLIGTPEYMSPEQAGGSAVDGRADLYSLGCALYHAATGRPPFDGPNVIAVLHDMANRDAPPLATLDPAIPAGLSDLIARLMRKPRDERPGTAADVAAALDRIDSAPAAPRRPARRWVVVAAGLLAAAAAVAGAVVIKIRKADGTETTVQVPDGSTVSVDEKGNVEIAAKKSEPPSPPKPPEQPDKPTPPPDRTPQPRAIPSPEQVWATRVRSLPAAERVEEVKAELKRRNPDAVMTPVRPTAYPGAWPPGGTFIRLSTARKPDLSPLALLDELDGLDLRGVSREGQLAGGVDDTVLAALAHLRRIGYLSLTGNPGVSNLAALGRTVRIETMSLSRTGVADLSPLADSGVSRLYVSETRVSTIPRLPALRLLVAGKLPSPLDLGGLKGVALESLDIRDTALADPAVLSGFPLQSLHVTPPDGPSPLREVVRGIRTLKQINDEPAADFRSQ